MTDDPALVSPDRPPDGAHYSIVGRRVALGPLRPELSWLHTSWVNDPDVGWNVFGAPQSRTEDEEREWLEREGADPRARFFLVYRLDRSRLPIGVTSLTAIDPGRRSGTFRILIGASGDRGQGFGSEATRLMLSYAFETLGLRAVDLDVFAFNVAALRLYSRLGFRETARRPNRVVRDGGRWDSIQMVCRASDYDPLTLDPAEPRTASTPPDRA